MNLFTNLKVHKLVVPLMMFFVGVFYPVQQANAQLANVSCTPVWSYIMRFTNITINGNSNAFSSAGTTYTGNGTNTNVSVSVLPSATVSFTWVGGLYSESTFYYGYCNVFVDWNNNGTFTDAGEWLQSNYGGSCCPGVATPPGPYAGSFVVPSTVTPGPKRMRFKFDYANNTTNPCNPYTSGWYGDFRDFTLNIGYNNDASVTKLATSTPAPFAPGTNTIQASVTNNGLNTLNSVQVNWSVNGVTQAPVSYSTAITAGSTAVVNLATQNFPAVGSLSVQAWTSLPNGTTDPNPANDMSPVVLLGAALNGTYTAGGNNPDFTGPAQAAAQITAGGTLGAVTINIRPGTYTESVYISTPPGNQSSRPIVFQSEDGNKNTCVIQFSGLTTPAGNTGVLLNSTSVGGTPTLRLNNADFVIIRNITLASLNVTYNTIVELCGPGNTVGAPSQAYGGSDNVTFDNINFNA